MSAPTKIPDRPSSQPARSTAVIRELILDAAREAFAAGGFNDTTTRQIAAKAGVVESLIYKHFRSKAGLFDEAIVQPFDRAVGRFITEWTPRSLGQHSGEGTARDYIENIYDLLENHAELLIALMKDRRQDKPLLPLLQKLEHVAAYELGSQGWVGVDIAVLVRLQFGAVAFNAAFGESLYLPGPGRPSRDRIVAEMVSFFVHGTAHRDGNGSTPAD